MWLTAPMRCVQPLNRTDNFDATPDWSAGRGESRRGTLSDVWAGGRANAMHHWSRLPLNPPIVDGISYRYTKTFKNGRRGGANPTITITYTKLTWQTYPAFKKKIAAIIEILLPFESGNFPDRDFLGPFSMFSLCSGYPDRDMYSLLWLYFCCQPYPEVSQPSSRAQPLD